MSTPEPCTFTSPCGLCVAKNAQSPARSTSSLSSRDNKPRPNPMALPPIPIPDKGDVVALKRANNTMAARKSRQKQIDRLERLEREADELSAERNHWKNWAVLIQKRYEIVFPHWIDAKFISREEIMPATPG